MTTLPETEWSRRALEHEARVASWTVPYRDRRARGVPHPVLDFLFLYYRYSTVKLAQWHPPLHEAVEDSPEARLRFPTPPYVTVRGLRVRDPAFLRDKDKVRLADVRDILRATAARPPHLGCLGMHEWAMVYRADALRHREAAPLRLSQAETDAFVETHPIVCTHYDAFRFFTPEARRFNRMQPTPESRVAMEQPGCIHANMDLYKWAYKSMPWVGSDLLWQAFELAVALRTLDMRASPYDLRALGYDPVRIETPEGREEYRTRQRALSEAAQSLRAALAEALDEVLARAGISLQPGEVAAPARATPTPARSPRG